LHPVVEEGAVPRRIVLSCLLFPIAASAATITVTRVDDPAPDGCVALDCSLREAVLLANGASGRDTIVLGPGTYQVARAGSDDAGQVGDLDSSGDLEIVGAGSGLTAIVSTVADRVLQATATLTLRHLSVQGGQANGSGIDGRGGAIHAGGKLTLQDVSFSGNHAALSGGAVFQDFDVPNGGDTSDILRIDSATFSDNSAEGDGGAVYQQGSLHGASNHPEVLFVSGSTFSGNTAGGGGGALYSVPDNSLRIGARLSFVTFEGNVAGDQGGAVVFAGSNPGAYYTQVDALVADSTFTGNHGKGDGGAIQFGSNRLFDDYGLVHGEVLRSLFDGNQVDGPGDASGGAMAGAEVVLFSTFSDNHVASGAGVGRGGAIAPGRSGRLVVLDSLLQGNTASSRGGGIDASSLTLRRSLVSGNSTASFSNAGKGGAIHLAPIIDDGDHSSEISDTTLSANAADIGGALYVERGSLTAPELYLESSTLTANTATISSGAMRTNEPVHLLNSTIDGNSAPSASGIVLFQTTASVIGSTLVGDAGGTGNVLYQSGSTSPAVTVLNSIVRGTCAFAGGPPPVNAGWTLESPGSTCGLTGASNLPNTSESALALGTLGDHGGRTPTRVPGAGSAAIDAGTSAFGFCPTVDQRGYVRSPDAPCDLGAVEAAGLDDALFRDDFQF
jgi:predicted outer membrane repeat protein